ncbi:MAG: Blue-light-activated protein [Gemmataceae bacterium]|nr:Blue-light-activated protein [Gemmataceae bacterium]
MTSSREEPGGPLAADVIPAPIFRIGPDLRVLAVNPAGAATLGRPAEAVVGRSPAELGFAPADAARLAAEVRDVFATGQPVVGEAVVKTPTGERWFQHRMGPELGPGGEVAAVVVVTADVTALKQSERALRASEERFHRFMAHTPLPAWVQDADGRYVYLNPAYERALGIRAADWVGKRGHDVWPAEVADRIQANIKLALETGRTVEGRELTPGPDGVGRTWLNVKFPYRDASGRGFVGGIAVDLTEQLRAEADRREFEKKMLQAQKLESLGVLAGGIAHDFNNLLTSVLGYASLGRFHLTPGDDQLAECFDHVEKAAVRAAELCQQMLAYAGRGMFAVADMDLNGLVGEIAQLLATVIRKKAVLKFNLADGLPAIRVDPTQIRQVVMNLITNASDAIGEQSGVITLTTGGLDADARYLADIQAADDLTPGRYVYLEVSDTGCGMTEDVIARVFDPFFTTKFTGRGLGLAAVQGIVRAHRGAIKVYSQPGRGSTFKVLFPAADPGPGPAADQLTPAALPKHGRGRLILVVDDEEDIRVMARKVLEMGGFSVELAPDGRAGVAAFVRHPDAVAAVLLDLTMPHLDGAEAFRELRQVRPDVTVLLTSGFAAHEAMAGFQGKGLAGFVRKPFRAQELLAAVFAAVGP